LRALPCKAPSPPTGAAAGYAVLAVAVTAGVHLAFGRRTILSVGISTACYVILINIL
jgi:branched-subunit amino acid transport protein AzlD